MKTFEQMVTLFENANQTFIQRDIGLFKSGVSERTLCGALMLHIHDLILKNDDFVNYYTDVEYNRNKGGRIKNIKKTIQGVDEQVVSITCDLILHSRGNCTEQDNLIAVEMKKSNRPPHEKHADKERLMALTKDSYDDVWSFDGKNLPEYVCRYVLGVYYEINYFRHLIKIEYYRLGQLEKTYEICYQDN